MAIQIRRGTDSGWESNNSNIVAGEPAVATDTERFFVGVDSGEYMELSNINLIAPQYDSSATYNVGDYSIHQGRLYVCNTANTTGAWNSSKWNGISLKQALDDLATRSVPTSVREAIYTLLNNCAYATTGLTDEIAVVQSWAGAVTSLTLSASSLSLSGSTPQTLIPTVVPSSASVSWSSSDNSIATVVGGVVTGVSNGSCVITASAGNLSANCSVTVSGFATLESISAVYTQSGTVYDTDSLDSLKADLVVTATYSDTSTETVPSNSYTLSGTLEVGTSTITVTYRGKTATFTVNVTQMTLTITSSSAGVGFGAIDNTKAYPYISNSNKNRIHALNTNSVGYPVVGGHTYKITISSYSSQQVNLTAFNTTGQTDIENQVVISNNDKNDFTGWVNVTSSGYQFTVPSTINGLPTACMWIVFRKDSSNTNWTSLDSSGIFPFTISEVTT